MPIPNHPDDERLSALAAHDDDAIADAALSSHVDACDRCTELVAELGLLRASLAELPDVAPSRPLRLLPPVAEPVPGPADRLGGWVRRFFAPALTAGAALAMVGLVGTAAPALEGMASGEAQDAAIEEVNPDSASRLSTGDGGDSAGEPGLMSTTDEPEADDGAAEFDAFDDGRDEAADEEAARSSPLQDLPAERSPWPMVLFTGVAVVVAALLLRWILVPRAG